MSLRMIACLSLSWVSHFYITLCYVWFGFFLWYGLGGLFLGAP